MEHEIQAGLGQNEAGVVECNDTVPRAKLPYAAPRLVLFGSFETLTLGNDLEVGTDAFGFAS